ncbi:unnamed protein product [Aspergillus oryzae RIB40]|uniref:DNA, SC012 n=1 Tax=Aspergillus oryzae (strain ATCC 42149 / RIB 40) TaxID=510516 RepID=Q2UDQ7_ASPOR|nr:unnamed protein product [Aspergillus oryzae RIB40]BAE60308.1 unnamed protein product [Aspergillus oryzae RIB40]
MKLCHYHVCFLRFVFPAGLGLESADTGFQSQTSLEAKADHPFALAQDAFGDESNAEVKYKVLSWCHDRRIDIPWCLILTSSRCCARSSPRPCDLFNGLWCCWACYIAHLFPAPDDEEYLMAFYTM